MFESYSQAKQDLFVLQCLKQKKNGFFLELGCNDPIVISNTYLLEKNYGWSGISIDISEKHIEKFKKQRSCESLAADCTAINYSEILKEKRRIDYLSLDLEPAEITFKCLQILPIYTTRFSIITYEHDQYRFGPDIKLKSRKIFFDAGYQLVCADVHNDDYCFEDWFIDPSCEEIDMNAVSKLRSEGLDHKKMSALTSTY